MAFFGFKSSKEVEEEKRKAAEAAVNQAATNNQHSLSNLGAGSQINIAIPYFDVFDPRLQDTGVPVSVHGSIVYGIEDMNLFRSLNKVEDYTDDAFRNKLRGQVTTFIKGVVSNAPSDAQIPLVQIERKIMEISMLVENYVIPKVERTFAIKVRSLDITNIMVDKESRGFRELKAMTADLESERVMAKHNAEMKMFNAQSDSQLKDFQMQSSLNRDAFATQHDLNMSSMKTQHNLNMDAMKRQHEMNLGGQEAMQNLNLQSQKMNLEQQRMGLDAQRMQMDHQSETLRIQREEMQRASKLQTEQTFMEAHKMNLNASFNNNLMNNGYNPLEQQQNAFGGNQMGGNQMGGNQMGGNAFGGNQMGGNAFGGNQMGGNAFGAKAMPNVQYMVAVNGQQAGPFDGQQLTQLAQQGQINAQTYVWTQGMPQWTMAGEVAELKGLFTGGMPPMPGM